MSENKKVIYFNHWFSSMECLIDDLKARYGDSIKIIASSSNMYATYKNIADTFIVTNETVPEWLDICEKYDVDLFFCRDKFDIVDGQALLKFRELSVDIVLDNNKLIDDKAEFYKLADLTCRFNKFPDIVVPYYVTFETCRTKSEVMDTLRNTLAYLALNNLTPTFKLINGEGGVSYREIRIKDTTSYNSIMYPNGRVLSYDSAINLFNNISLDEAKTLMIMEKLKGPEISIDCYNSKSLGLIAYGREKADRRQVITDCQTTKNNDYIEMKRLASEIANKFNLKNPFNIQFMRSAKTGSLALLEVNSRMSGGCYMLTPLGINLCDIVIKDRLGDGVADTDIKFSNGTSESIVARVEKPILM